MTTEWVGTVAVIAALALAVGNLGEHAEHRLAGDIVRDAQGELRAFATTRRARSERNARPIVPFAAPTHPAPEVPDIHDNRPPSSHAQCNEHFVDGAFQAFIHGEGEILGDVFGTTDARLKRDLWDRPAQEVLGELGRGAVDAAPAVVAATPTVLAAMKDGAIVMVQGLDRDTAMQTAGQVVDVLFVDSFRTAGRLSADGWHGSRTLIAAARSGDCIAFGQTLRSGVNNVPEALLTALDVVPAAGTAFAFGKGAAKFAKARALTAAVVRIAAQGTRLATHGAHSAASITARAIRDALPHAYPHAVAPKLFSLPGNALASAENGARLLRNVTEAAVRRGVAAWVATETTLHHAVQSLVEQAANTARQVTAQLSGMNDFRFAHANGSGLDARLFGGSDPPWWGVPFVGAMRSSRSAREIRDTWPSIHRDWLVRVALWDLGHARSAAADDLLNGVERALRPSGSAVLDTTMRREFARGLLLKGHGNYLKQRQSPPDVLEQLRRFANRESDDIDVLDFEAPPVDFLVGRDDAWDVLGMDLRVVEREAYESLTARFDPDDINTPTNAQLWVRAARELSLAAVGYTGRQQLTPKVNETAQALSTLEHARLRFDNAELSKRVANEVTRRSRTAAIDPDILERAGKQPISIYTPGDIVLSSEGAHPPPLGWQTLVADDLEVSISASLAEQAQGERRVREIVDSFLDDFEDRKVRVEIYAPDIAASPDSAALYHVWMQNETLCFVEANVLEFRRGFLPDHLLLGGQVVPPDTVVVRGLGDWTEDEIFEVQRAINNWRTGTSF